VNVTAELELQNFIDKFAPAMRQLIHQSRTALSVRFPNMFQLVYDNYNFFVIGFGPTRRPSEAVFSLAASKTGLSLCFLQNGVDLPDPTSILRGSGKVVRTVRLTTAADLERPDISALIDEAAARASVPMSRASDGELIIQSVSAKQRPRQ
jgi:hypothetical protein